MESTPTLVIVTVTKVESQAVFDAFLPDKDQRPKPQTIEGHTYFELDMVQDARVYMVQSEMGSGGLGASAQAVAKAIETLAPRAVIMVGIAFGVNQEKQAIGDVLVSQQLRLYDLQRVGTRKGRAEIVLRGDKPSASSNLINRFRGAELTWEGEAEIRFGPILTGEKLVDNQDFTKQLQSFEPEAIGGEMEGAGLYVACHDKKIDWILVKGICDWADGNKAEDKAARQQLAATNAAAFVYHALNFSTGSWSSKSPRSFSADTKMGDAVQGTPDRPAEEKQGTGSNPKYQVFISSTYDDLKVEREAVIKAVLEMGHIPVGMEMFSAADEEQWRIITRQIDQSDYYVVIVAHRYGAIVKQLGGISDTEREYDYAVSQKIPVLGFIIDDKASWPAERMDRDSAAIKALSRFKTKAKRRPVGFWTTTEDLYARTSIALTKAFVNSPRPGWIRASDKKISN